MLSNQKITEINLRLYDMILIFGHQHVKNILRFSKKIIFMCQREGGSYLKVFFSYII